MKTMFCFILDIYEDSVPFDSPPSYKGLAVKYCYKITVGAGRLQSTTKLVRLPVRILVLEGKVLFSDRIAVHSQSSFN